MHQTLVTSIMVSRWNRKYMGILKLDYPLIIFINQKWNDDIKEITQIRNGKSTAFIPLSFDELPYNKLNIELARTKHPIINLSNDNASIPYLINNWSKMFYLDYAVDKNPFNSTHFGWIDFELELPATVNLDIVIDKMRLMEIQYFDNKINEREPYFKQNRHYVSTQYVTGSIKSWTELIEIFDREIEFAIKYQFAPFDDQILPLIILEYPDLFENYYGNRHACLINYHEMKTAEYILLVIMKYCRETRNYKRGYLAGKWLDESSPSLLDRISDNEKGIDYTDLANFYDEYYLCAFYYFMEVKSDPEQKIITEIAMKFAHLIKTNVQFANACKPSLDRIKHNFLFLKNKISWN